MSQAEDLPVPIEGRVFTYDEVSSNVTRVNVGDTVEVPRFRTQFDPLVISLINATVSADRAGTQMRRWLESYQDPENQDPLGSVAVQGSQGLNWKQQPIYPGWPTGVRLPSDSLKPKNYIGDVRGAQVTVLGATLDEIPDEPPLRGIELLLQGEIRSSRGVRIQKAARFSVQKSGSNHPRIQEQLLRGQESEQLLTELRRESIKTARELSAEGLKKVIRVGIVGSNEGTR
jgi:hypothetical protein